ncbi:MAG: FliH/SctL family protein, partial [Rhizobacter sp.]
MRNVPPPEGAKAASPYARFIPREELGAFATWSPGTLAGDGQSPSQSGVRKAAPAEPEKPAAPDLGQQLHAARQGGYQDGYRDGLAALEGFKQSFAHQTTLQVGALVESIAAQLEALQQAMAESLSATAANLARQIVRAELGTRPELVAQVAEEAVDTLLL